jgi:hypothetical protein
MKRSLLISVLVVSGCTALVADEEPAQRQRQALVAAALDGGTPPAGLFPGPVFKGEARQRAMAEVERLKPIQARHEAMIMSQPGVFGLGIGHDAATARFVFKVMVDVEAAVPPLPAALEGVPLLVVRETPPRAENGGACNPACHSGNFTLPVQMGNSGIPAVVGGLCSACTMGFKACRASTGESMWVTAAHCSMNATTCPGSAPLGTPAFHTSPLDSANAGFPACSQRSNVGVVAVQSPPFPNGLIDASAISSDGSKTQLSVRDIGIPDTVPGAAFILDPVRKSGRTTGLTFGTVALINVTVTITYNCGFITLVGQVWIVGGANTCAGGDSGAGWFNDSTPPQVVGLHIAGTGTSCYANQAALVLAALGLTMDHSACPESCPAIDLSSGTDDRSGYVARFYRLRDEVLGQSEQGKTWIRRFYEVSPTWVALYAKNPALFVATTKNLMSNGPVLEAVARQTPITVSRSRLDALLALVDQHIAATEDAKLRGAFTSWRNELQDPTVQRLFGITVQ